MAVNPLFSGPGQSSHSHQYRLHWVHHSQNDQLTTPLRTQEVNEMESPAPRKKPRLNSDGNMETDQDEDPFEDFEECLTADDLDTIDMIASQALSQVQSNSSNAVIKVASSTSHRQLPKPAKHTKIEQVHPPYDKKERPKSSGELQTREHPIQTNVNIPFHQLGKRSAKTAMPTQVICSGNNFLKKKSTGGGGDGNARNQLTPPKGTTVVDSSACPGGTKQDEFPEVHKLQQQVEMYKAETESLNQRLKALKSEKYRKDGEIEVLRQNLNKAHTDISRLQIERIQKDEQKQREQAHREKQLEREVEALKTQLEFKEHEIVETQASFRNLQQRACHEGQQGTNSNSASPRKSPRLVQVSSPSRKAFPTKSSFMTGSTKLQDSQRSPGATKGSPSKDQIRNNKVNSPGSSVSPNMTSSSSSIKKWNPPTAGVAVQLKTRISNGCVTPSLMVGLLLKDRDDSKSKLSQGSSNLIDVFTRLRANGSQGESATPSSVRNNTDSDREPPEVASREIAHSSAQNSACQAISLLLNSGSQCLSVPLPRHPSASSAPSLSEYHLAKIIPVIQEQLDCYTQELESMTERIRSSAGSEQGALGVVIDEQCWEESVVKCRSKALVAGLQTLSKLCSHSESICKMITAGCDQTQNAMETSVDEIDPSAPITFTQSSSRGRSSCDQSCLSEWTKEPCRVVQLLQSILKCHPVRGHPCRRIRESGWQLISVLCRNTPDSGLKWCVPLLVQDSLPLALSATISTVDTFISAIAVTAAVSGEVSVCSQSDSCPLSHIYQLGTSLKSNEEDSDDGEITRVRLELISLLLTIVSSQVNGASSLVETNCQCTYELVASVVFIMLEELKLVDINKATQRRWFLLKQGLLFLHIIVLQTRALAEQKIESEMELMHLVVRLHRLLKNASEIDKSQVCMLQDIWECVAGDDDVWEDELEDEDEAMQED